MATLQVKLTATKITSNVTGKEQVQFGCVIDGSGPTSILTVTSASATLSDKELLKQQFNAFIDKFVSPEGVQGPTYP